MPWLMLGLGLSLGMLLTNLNAQEPVRPNALKRLPAGTMERKEVQKEKGSLETPVEENSRPWRKRVRKRAV